VEKNGKSLFWIPLAILWAQQLHFSGSLLWLNVIGLFLIFRPPFPWRYFTAGLTGGLLPYIPYLMTKGMQDIWIILKHLFLGADTPESLSVTPLKAFLQIGGDSGRNDMLGAVRESFLKDLIFYQWIAAMFGLVLVLGMVIALVEIITAIKMKQKDKMIFPMMCLFWMATPVIIFSILKVTFLPFYLLTAVPASFLTVIYFWRKITGWMGRVGVVGVILFFCVWGAGQVIYLAKMYALLATCDMQDPVQTCLRYQSDAAKCILDASQKEPCYIIQSARQSSLGLDYSCNYLLWHHKGGDVKYLFNLEDFEYLLLIRDSKDKFTDWFATWCEQFPHQRFGNVKVYKIPRKDLLPKVKKQLELP
jgi:hypothetical protein